MFQQKIPLDAIKYIIPCTVTEINKEILLCCLEYKWIVGNLLSFFLCLGFLLVPHNFLCFCFLFWGKNNFHFLFNSCRSFWEKARQWKGVDYLETWHVLFLQYTKKYWFMIKELFKGSFNVFNILTTINNIQFPFFFFFCKI